VNALNSRQLETSYREGAWTVRQIVHHIADSHMNSYIRFRWAITENEPTIKAYDENDWAKLVDAKNAPVELSLDLIKALHARWVWFLSELDANDYNKSFVHPESGEVVSLRQNLAYYAWHGQHHLAHIKIVKGF
ncbi:MAG TPA: putative metal-dependent hydrolase, partial [Trueperaceae bacterium]|nr:putative metal-dependent hydrolase [Trueperaceae bacterium]